MKKLIILALIFGLAVPASADIVAYHFTAVMDKGYSDNAQVFEELEITQGMTMSGFFAFDSFTESQPGATDPADLPSGRAQYLTGLVVYGETQDGLPAEAPGYTFIMNAAEDDPDVAVRVIMLRSLKDWQHVLTINAKKRDTNIPIEIALFEDMESLYTVTIPANGTSSSIQGRITELTPYDEYMQSLAPAETDEGSVEEDLAELKQKVKALKIKKRAKKKMQKDLKKAQKKLTDGNPKNDQAVVGLLQSFIKKVNKRKGKKIQAEMADELIVQAEGIIAKVESRK